MRHKYKVSWQRSLHYFLVLAILIIGSNLAVKASNEMQTPMTPPGVPPMQGAGPPPGAGPNAAPEITGDVDRRDVPSGSPTSNPVSGSNFPTQDPKRRPRINLQMNGETVMTFQPGQLTNQQRGQVMGVIGGGAMAPGQVYQNINVSQNQLTQMQNILAPNPDSIAGCGWQISLCSRSNTVILFEPHLITR